VTTASSRRVAIRAGKLIDGNADTTISKPTILIENADRAVLSFHLHARSSSRWHPAPSPDAKRLAFVSSSELIDIANVDGTGTRHIASVRGAQ
jgi:hypothetical protein